MNGVEGPKLRREKRAREAQYPVVDPDEVTASEDSTTRGERLLAASKQGSENLHMSKGAGHPRLPAT